MMVLFHDVIQVFDLADDEPFFDADLDFLYNKKKTEERSDYQFTFHKKVNYGIFG